MHIFLLSAPAQSGKDEAVRQVLPLYPSLLVERFANPIYYFMQSVFPEFRPEHKDLPCPWNPKITWRQVMIDFSENYMKRTLGLDIFGRMLAARLQRNPNPLVLVPDSRFLNEALALAKVLPDANYALVRISRNNRPVIYDTYTYWSWHYPTYEIPNNGTREELGLAFSHIIEKEISR